MNEWTIVTTIVVIVGLIVTVTTPLLNSTLASRNYAR